MLAFIPKKMKLVPSSIYVCGLEDETPENIHQKSSLKNIKCQMAKRYPTLTNSKKLKSSKK